MPVGHRYHGAVTEPASAPLSAIAKTSEKVRATRGRLDKRGALSELFATLSPADLRVAVAYLSGELPQGRLGVGWRTLTQAADTRHSDAPRQGNLAFAPTPARVLTIAEVHGAFDRIKKVKGAGSKRRRLEAVQDILGRADETTRRFLGQLLMGELRQGAQRSLVVDALAVSLAVDPAALRRAVMFAGKPGPVAEAVAREGAAALARFGLAPGVPVEPMLASTAASLEEALADIPGAALEWKLDGVRVQIHRYDGRLTLFSRKLRDVTDRVPELGETLAGLPGERFVLDGEVLGLDANGRPAPFQDLMSRFSRDESPARARQQLGLGEVAAASGPISGAVADLALVLFDILILDDDNLVDAPYRQRRAVLEERFPPELVIPQRYATEPAVAEEFYQQALDAQHEGLMIKDPKSTYAAGRRGSHWRKLKPAVTVDLVILAAEWGHGRREGWLSNLHLGARDPSSPYGFRMLGKTFKGLTDAMLQQLTDDLPTIATSEEDRVMRVRPERVVEIAFDIVQRSPRYDSGLALRFARVKRFRPDKRAEDATTLDEIREIHRQQR